MTEKAMITAISKRAMAASAPSSANSPAPPSMIVVCVFEADGAERPCLSAINRGPKRKPTPAADKSGEHAAEEEEGEEEEG
jgi:hypothetical protein